MATITSSRPGPTAGHGTLPLNHSHPFTCVTCAIAFRSSELQRGHMRSDWHRYNLKRRVASLPPLSSETFAEKVLTAQASSSAAAARASFEKTCEACQKTYYSQNAYSNHLGSQKHKANLAAVERTRDQGNSSVLSSTISLGEPIEDDTYEHISEPQVEVEFFKMVQGVKDTKLAEDSLIDGRLSRSNTSSLEAKKENSAPALGSASPVGTNVPTTMPISRCLFCNYDSPSLKLSVLHMTKFHAMFIPEQLYLTDLEGLVTYLQAKITENHECLFCHKLKGSTSGVQTHMRDKGHCMIAFDHEEEMIEIGQFYDFRSTYSDEDLEDSDVAILDADAPSISAKLGAKRSKEGNIAEEGNDGWETDSSASSLDSSDLHAVPIDHDHAYERLASHRHHTHSDPRSHRAPDGFHSHAHSHHAAFHSDHELHLPSGRTAGHRSLARYYRQNLHNYLTPDERIQQRLLAIESASGGNSDDISRSNDSNRQVTRANGGLGMLGVTEAKKREVAAVAKREQKRAQRNHSHFQWGKEKRSNKQKHFRDDNYGI